MTEFAFLFNLAAAAFNAAIYLWFDGTVVNLALVPLGLAMALLVWISA